MTPTSCAACSARAICAPIVASRVTRAFGLVDRHTLNQLHRQEQEAVLLAGLVDRHDVRVVQGPRDFGFAAEAQPVGIVVGVDRV
jgi:hypothetical protein